MYSFNKHLLERLPSLFGMNANEFTAYAGVKLTTFRDWIAKEEPIMKVSNFVSMLNRIRISMADFLLPDGPQPLSDNLEMYTIPKDEWKDITWNNEGMTELYGPNSIIGITSGSALAKKLGLASFTGLKNSIINPNALTVKMFIHYMNTLHLDAKRYIIDRNRIIRVPRWSDGIIDISEYARLEEENRLMKSSIDELHRRIASLRQETEDYRRENMSLRSRLKDKEGDGAGHRLLVPEYRFHEKLWSSLPFVFGMNTREFCRAAGISPDSYSRTRNVDIRSVVNACNAFHISIRHFFVPRGETGVVRERWAYEIPERQFTPIESRMEYMGYLFRQGGGMGVSFRQLARISGVGLSQLRTMTDNTKVTRIMSLMDICNSFGISPCIFFLDSNIRHLPKYPESRNETLLRNCIRMDEELCRLKTKKE